MDPLILTLNLPLTLKVEALRELLDSGVNPNALDKHGRTLLEVVKLEGKEDCIKLLEEVRRAYLGQGLKAPEGRRARSDLMVMTVVPAVSGSGNKPDFSLVLWRLRMR